MRRKDHTTSLIRKHKSGEPLEVVKTTYPHARILCQTTYWMIQKASRFLHGLEEKMAVQQFQLMVKVALSLRPYDQQTIWR